MLGFLKKLFKKDEKKAEKVSLDNLEKWFEGQITHFYEELDKDLINFKEKLKEEIQKTNENITTLERAKLQNPEITTREIQFMQGNRESYIKRVQLFLEQINVNDLSSKTMTSFISEFHRDILEFGKATIRPYHILQQFFANESSKVSQNIKSLDILVKQLKNLEESSNLRYLDDLKDSILKLKNQIKLKHTLEQDVKGKKQEVEELEKEVSNDIKELEKLKKSNEYISLDHNKKLLVAAEKELKNEENDLLKHFSVLDKALRKYERVMYEDSEIVLKYVQDPLAAVLTDTEFKILAVLPKLKEKVENDKLILEDRKKEKTLETIPLLTKEFFENFLNRYKDLIGQREALKVKIESANIYEVVMKKEERIVALHDRIKQYQEKIESLTSEHDKIDIPNLKLTVATEIKDKLNKEIIVT